ncbi:MAG TPA: helix-turn-helix transcriptional regulator [Ktedonobacteraceae bacterium]|nr:helix-turn-helix transcriptional regulator [Ktedonobacteraceae bacterium]
MIYIRLKEIAQEKGFSQGKLSRASDVDDNTIKRIYRNPTATVTTETLSKLAKALGVSVHELIVEISDEKQERDQC